MFCRLCTAVPLLLIALARDAISENIDEVRDLRIDVFGDVRPRLQMR